MIGLTVQSSHHKSDISKLDSRVYKMSTSDSCKDGTSKSNNDDDVCEVNDMLHNISTADDNENNVSVCANCGKEGSNLKACTACKLVKYCGRDCQQAHRSQHKIECRRRAAELHDEKLFKQPPMLEDCPICFIQLPILHTGKRYMACCGKEICSGCSLAPEYDNQGNKIDYRKCPFCRASGSTSQELANERVKARADADDPIAIHNLGCKHADGTYGFPRDYNKALELWHKAAELGHAASYCNIGIRHYKGQGVEVDEKKATYYYELAAMEGNADARHNLGAIEGKAGKLREH